jgi:F-type H+-transporting ATPase subunit delta
VSDRSIARVYAEALFDAAAEADSIARTSADLRGFVAALDESAPLANVVFNPQIEPRARRRVIATLARDADPLAAGLLSVLLEKGRIGLVREVVDIFDDLADEAARVVEVEVTTAVPVDVADRVAARVRQKTGLEARLTTHVDPAILGGLVLRIGDTVMDASLRARMAQLRKRMQLAEVRGNDQ